MIENDMLPPDGSPGLGFEGALGYLRQGKRARRAGWNGKGMYIVMMAGYPEGIPANQATAEAHGIEPGTLVKVRPYLVMKDAQGYLVPGWLASQTDLLSDDWEVVEA
jgi:hypothetical protein